MNKMRKVTASISLGIATLAMLTAVAVATQKADYVFTNGAIYTIDSKNPRAQAIAITGKYITYVGTNYGAQAFVGDKTRVFDLHGQMLLPGFVESHIHPTMALVAEGADLQFDSLDQLLTSVKEWADAHPNAKVIRGFGWRYTLFPTTGPTKEVLDKLVPRPSGVSSLQLMVTAVGSTVRRWNWQQ